MSHFFLVALGGALGVGLRHLANLTALRLFGPGFPIGTMVVNVIGSFLMGVLIAYLARKGGSAGVETRLFLATGLLGGFTTFSAFSLDAVLLWERGEGMAAALYVFGSVCLSILALTLGLVLVRAAT